MGVVVIYRNAKTKIANNPSLVIREIYYPRKKTVITEHLTKATYRDNNNNTVHIDYHTMYIIKICGRKTLHFAFINANTSVYLCVFNFCGTSIVMFVTCLQILYIYFPTTFSCYTVVNY